MVRRSGDGPTPIHELLDRGLEQAGVARPVDVADLVERWPDLAGEPWASRSRPVHLQDGELVVEADGGPAASLLRYQVSALVDRLERELGPGLVTVVRVRRAGPGGRR